MKLINELKKEESEDKPKCEIKFETYISSDGKFNEAYGKPAENNFISIIAHLSENRYIFETYNNKNHRGTSESGKYIGTWNGVEQ